MNVMIKVNCRRHQLYIWYKLINTTAEPTPRARVLTEGNLAAVTACGAS